VFLEDKNIKQIYFNHIPRTGGTYVNFSLRLAGIKNIKYNDVVIKTLTTEEDYNDKITNIVPNDIINSNFITGHLSILPNVLVDNLKTVTIFRDPVKRIVSDFAMTYHLINNIKTISNDLFPKQENNNIKQMFFNWCNLNINQNVQSNNLINPVFYAIYENDKRKTICDTKLWEQINNKEVNFLNIKNAIDDLKVVGINEKIDIFINDFFNLINKEFNSNIKNPYLQDRVNSTKMSSILYNELTDKEIDSIINLNSVDFQAWEYAKSLLD
jgi:hypothetical protein